MDKQQIYSFLNEHDVWFEVTEHQAVYNMQEVSKVNLPYPNADAKNIFVRDDKKRKYYLITVDGSHRVDLKKFSQDHGTRNLSFASESDLKDKLGLSPGSVTPFGLLNNKAHDVDLYLDKQFTKGSGIIGVHPNDNTATVWMKIKDLANIIQEHGNQVVITDIL